MPSETRRDTEGLAVVYLDKCGGGTFAGQIYDPIRTDGTEFAGVMEFLKKMECVMRKADKPRLRPGQYGSCVSPEPDTRPWRLEPGRKGTFEIRVLFQRNADWQGTVTWMEKRREEAFQSILELLLLMDGAATEETKKRENRYLFSCLAEQDKKTLEDKG